MFVDAFVQHALAENSDRHVLETHEHGQGHQFVVGIFNFGALRFVTFLYVLVTWPWEYNITGWTPLYLYDSTSTYYIYIHMYSFSLKRVIFRANHLMSGGYF